MTQGLQPDALRLAEILEGLGWRSVDKELRTAAAELRRLHAENTNLLAALEMHDRIEKQTHAENTTLQQGYDAARLEIESLQAQLSAIGAGGVEPLRKPLDDLTRLTEQMGGYDDDFGKGDHPTMPDAVTRDDTVHGQEYYPAGPMRAYLDAVCAALASTAAQPPAGWQPIETAPKDGTPVLAVTDEGITVIRYSMRHNNKDYWRLAVNSSYPADEGFGEATHWMHLPAAPKE